METGFERKVFPAHGIIFEEGEAGDAAYLITQGMVEIRKGVLAREPISLATLHKGDVFGEMALFDDRPRMAQALAITDVQVIAISRDEFLGRIQDVDPVIKTVMLYMVQRVRLMADEFMVRRTEVNWSQWKKID